MSDVLHIFDIDKQLARLKHANTQGSSLANSIQAWSKASLSTTPIINSDRKGWALRLDVAKPPPFDDWSLILSDATNQLRSALDNLVFSVLTPLPSSGAAKNEKLIKFPIASSAKEWKSAKVSIEHLPVEYRDRIEQWQPFQRLSKGGNLEEDGLVWLQRLSNVDKHALQVEPLISTSEMNHEFALEFVTLEDAGISLPPQVEVINPKFEDGALLMRQLTAGKIQSVKGNYHVKARVLVNLEGGQYGITELLANIWEYTAVTMQYVTGIADDEWKRWYSSVT
ncbi:MAG TPA: hypothetical protein VLA77_02530 [Candidatus Saccharimonadales bacterium]|nr:hypothetical protein [Candidatus Saccharimonadales bacterium]